MVNANITEYEREHDVNHQYTEKTRTLLGIDETKCVRCGHIADIHNEAGECLTKGCDCHD